MSSPLRILHLEDDPKDADLLQATLEADGFACNITRVENRINFCASLEKSDFDLILADYTLPSFDGISALKIVMEMRPELPFIFVSGTLDEEVAIDALKIGATDYVFKTRLSRITPALQRALRECQNRAERKRAQDALQRSEGYLAEAQKISQTGSFGWSVSTGALFWSEETFRIFQYDRMTTPMPELVLQRTHPEDVAFVLRTIERATRELQDFDISHRLLMPDGSVKHVHVLAHAVRDISGEIEFIGTVRDVTERKRAEDRLRKAQSELAHANRVTTMGELAASVAHEVNQPIAAAVTNANTCLRWLMRDQPDLEEARAAAMRIVKDATRAGEIINRIRLFFSKSAQQWELTDVDEIIRGMIALLRDEAIQHKISFRAELATGIPKIMGDRVQLQQVMLNLIMNGIDAMKDVDRPRELIIKTQRTKNDQLLVSVSDTGVGLPEQNADQIFNAFFTTKAQGIGMGLSISRSIVEMHGGRLWAEKNAAGGAIFLFTLPAACDTVI
ncbi:MAG TPA: ATP-binding protein [Candidatus Acidoferrales bacterium]|nr:ATP-binding protein [Candidatus Acidoferrales bacterium]